MAWLEKRGGRFRVGFRYAGKKFHHELKTESEREANALVGRVEENLILPERGKFDPPTNGDLALFLLSDGKITEMRMFYWIKLAGVFLVLHITLRDRCLQ